MEHVKAKNWIGETTIVIVEKHKVSDFNKRKWYIDHKGRVTTNLDGTGTLMCDYGKHKK